MRFLKFIMGAMALAVSVPAWAASLPDGGVTQQEVAASLQSANFPAELTTDKDGDPLIRSNYNGTKFSVWFYECKTGRCKSFQYAAGYSGTKMTLQKLGDWNRTKRFGRAYLDKDDDPWVEMDIDVEHGATTEALSNDLDRWLLVMREFGKFLGR